MQTLTIRLTAPLQSYGNEAQFSRRTTWPYPSKSAVIGLLAAALGYPRNDARIMTLNELSFAVRVDQLGQLLTDFHTVEWKVGTRKVTYRDYLQDAVFVVAVGSEDAELIGQLEYALHHPIYSLSLGRRANVPAGPLRTERFANQDPVVVLQNYPWQAASWYQKRVKSGHDIRLEVVADANLLPEAPNDLVKDTVISFSQQNRQFEFRSVASQMVTIHGPESQPHDAFGAV